MGDLGSIVDAWNAQFGMGQENKVRKELKEHREGLAKASKKEARVCAALLPQAACTRAPAADAATTARPPHHGVCE